jgi:hypothetical protein
MPYLAKVNYHSENIAFSFAHIHSNIFLRGGRFRDTETRCFNRIQKDKIGS